MKRQAVQQQQPQPRVVLTEEEYTETLSNIIQRDFFPQVPELERQAAILERRAAHDFAGAVAVRRAARRLQQHEQALADQEAIEETEDVLVLQEQGGGDGNQEISCLGVTHTQRRVNSRPLHRESVTGFHARVTNADDAEFDQQQREELQAARDHLEQVFSRQQHLRLGNGAQTTISETPLLASDAYNKSPHRITAAEWKPPAIQNGLFFTPSTASWNGSSNPMDNNPENPTLLLTKNSSTTATLSTNAMPPPASRRRESTLAISTSSLPQQEQYNSLFDQSNLVEYIPKHVLVKKIEPSRTRFPSTTAVLSTSLPHTLDIVATNSSTEDCYTTDASNSTDLDATPRSLDHERQARQKRQRREQERLVVMTPLLAPGRDGVSASPIMTWGEVSSTPLVLGGSAAAAAAAMEPQIETSRDQCFVIPAPSERDQRAAKAQATFANLARQRVSSSSSQLRSTNAAVRATPKSSTSLSRLDSLTPAARSLLEKMTATSSSLRSSLTSSSSSTPRSRDAFGTALRASYNNPTNNRTPQRSSSSSSNTSRHRMSHSNTRNDDASVVNRPRRVSDRIPPTVSEAAQTTANPTDGLLELRG